MCPINGTRQKPLCRRLSAVAICRVQHTAKTLACVKEPLPCASSINDTNDSLEMKQTIPCAIPISRVYASTSCIDLIDESCSNPCNEKCNEKCNDNVIVESCDDLIAKENDELKQEVERLMKGLSKLKGKGMESNVQPSQDNRENMVKKLEKGSIVTCSKCHYKGHKSDKCSQPKKKFSDEKNKKKLTIKSSLIYTKPNRKNKSDKLDKKM